MQLDNTRVKNAINWWRYAKDFAKKPDEYGAFFAAWIALIILTKDYEAQYCSNLSRKPGDKQSVECFFSRGGELILSAIHDSKLAENRSRLSNRHGGEIIRNVQQDRHSKKSLVTLAQIWNKGLSDNFNELIGVRELLLQVRNGLFHGGKMYNDDATNRENDDRQLLSDLNPILFKIVESILQQPGPHLELLSASPTLD